MNQTLGGGSGGRAVSKKCRPVGGNGGRCQFNCSEICIVEGVEGKIITTLNTGLKQETLTACHLDSPVVGNTPSGLSPVEALWTGS